MLPGRFQLRVRVERAYPGIGVDEVPLTENPWPWTRVSARLNVPYGDHGTLNPRTFTRYGAPTTDSSTPGVSGSSSTAGLISFTSSFAVGPALIPTSSLACAIPSGTFPGPFPSRKTPRSRSGHGRAVAPGSLVMWTSRISALR